MEESGVRVEGVLNFEPNEIWSKMQETPCMIKRMQIHVII